MRVVVTGGAGFIGSTLVDRLLAERHEVIVVDDFSAGSMANLAEARDRYGAQLDIQRVDIRDEAVIGVMAQSEPEVVVHLAAQADVRRSVTDPVFDAQVNLIGLLHVVEGARSGGARKVVFASSGGTIYGEPAAEALPVDESHSQHPVSPYGVSKKAATDYLHSQYLLFGLDYTSLALANVYGPRQDPHGEAGVVAIFAGRLLTGDPCTIFGSGEATRDYVYVDDVVDAFVRATRPGVEGGAATLMNIGTGRETSVKELYAAMASAAGVETEAIHADARTGELDRSSLSPALAGEVLGWRPQVDLVDGTTRVLDWFRENRLNQ